MTLQIRAEIAPKAQRKLSDYVKTTLQIRVEVALRAQQKLSDYVNPTLQIRAEVEKTPRKLGDFEKTTHHLESLHYGFYLALPYFPANAVVMTTKFAKLCLPALIPVLPAISGGASLCPEYG